MEFLRQVAEHHHHDNDGERLNRELGQSDVGSTQQEHLQGHTGTGSTNHDRTRQAVLRTHQPKHGQGDDAQREQIPRIVKPLNARVKGYSIDAVGYQRGACQQDDEEDDWQDEERRVVCVRHAANKATELGAHILNPLEDIVTGAWQELALLHPSPQRRAEKNAYDAGDKYENRNHERNVQTVPQCQMRVCFHADGRNDVIERAVQNSHEENDRHGHDTGQGRRQP